MCTWYGAQLDTNCETFYDALQLTIPYNSSMKKYIVADRKKKLQLFVCIMSFEAFFL